MSSDQPPSFLSYRSIINHSAIARREIHPILCTGAAMYNYLCHRCRIPRCRQSLTSGEDILAFLELRTSTRSANTRRYVELWRILLVDGMQVCNTQCDRSCMSNGGIASFRFWWVCCHNSAAAMACFNSSGDMYDTKSP